jgi:hypothetical protein
MDDLGELEGIPYGVEGIQEQLRMACQRLMEHFDTVQIIATKKDTDNVGTDAFWFGQGNWYARYGSVKEWAIEAESIMAERAAEEDDELD